MRSFRRRHRPLSCAKVGALLQHYLDDALDPRRAARLAAHLEDCRRCGMEADTYRRIKGELERRGRLDDADDAVRRLRAFGEGLRNARGDLP